MPKLKLVLGPVRSGKTRKIYEAILSGAEAEKHRNFILVVPEQFSHAVTKELTALHPRHALMNIDVLSFGRFAHRIFDSAGGDTAEILDDTGKNLILKRIASARREELSVLGANIRKQGYISEIKSVISEFIQYDIGEEEIEAMCGGEDHRYLSMKLRDIGILYRDFREKMGDEYTTKEELLDKAEKAAGRAAFLKDAVVAFDSFTGFTPIQYRFIRRLLDYVDTCMAALPYDGVSGSFFSLTVRTVAALRALAADAGFQISTETLYGREKPGKLAETADGEQAGSGEGVPSIGNYDAENGVYGGTEALNFLGSHLFRREKASFRGEPRGIRLIRGDTPRSEACFAASEITRLIREEGYRYREIGIVMSDVNCYGRLLEEEMERASIPCFTDTTSHILLNPYTEFIRAALEVETENFSYESVFRFLRTGLSGFSPEETDRLENYVRAMRIRGRKRYSERFVIHTKWIAGEELESVNEVRERFARMFQPLDEVTRKKKVTAGQYTKALRNFLLEQGTAEKMEALSGEFLENGKEELSRQYSQVIKKTEDLFDRIEQLISEETMSFSEFRETLDAGFDEIRIGVIPPGADRVTAGDMTRSRFSGIKALFFLGLNEGLLPKENTGAGILSDLDRRVLSEKSFHLAPLAREKAEEEKLYFYLCAAKPTEHLYLSYAGSDGEGRVLRPSWFVRPVRQLFPELPTEEVSEASLRQALLNPGDALMDLGERLKKPADSRTAALMRFFSGNPLWEDRLDLMVEAAFRSHRTDPVSRAAAAVLYGEEGAASPSRLEKYASCAYAHFLRYALRLREREEFGFERRDLGTVLHGVLERCGELLTKKGLTFGSLSDAEGEALAEEALDLYLRENENVVLMGSERNRYFIKRVARIIHTAVHSLRDQAASGGFRSEAFEKTFSGDGFFGRIDRIDMAEKGSAVYCSVIDYKSGNKEFDLSRIYYGLDLQLVIYLNGAMEVTRAAHPGKTVLPAGIFYYHIDDPSVEEKDLKTGSSEEIREKIQEKLRLRGLVNSDPEVISLLDQGTWQKSRVIPVSFKKDGSFSETSSVLDEEGFRLLSDHVRKLARNFRREIAEGEIGAEPVRYEKRLACEFCDYRDCCGFDERIPGYSVRELSKIRNREELKEKLRESADEQ